MPSVTNARFGYGSIQFVKAVEEVPTSSKTQGNVTINNMGSAGIPAYFEATFMLSSTIEAEGVTRDNIFHWSTILPDRPASTPYLEIEAEAARQLAPSLRELADAIEKEVAAFDSKLAETKPA